MRHCICILGLAVAFSLTGCQTHHSNVQSPEGLPKMSTVPDGVRIKASIDSRQEFVVNVMPQSDGKCFHPSFLVINEESDNFSTQRIEDLIKYYHKVRSEDSVGILVVSNHYLVQWDAKDRKAARGTVLQERHFSPEWKSYREAERALIDKLIQAAIKTRIQLWINEEMNRVSGKWELMTPPFDLEVRGDAKAIEKRIAEIRPELTKVFKEDKEAGKLPGLNAKAHGEADFRMRGGWLSVDHYPLRIEVRVQVEGSVDLLEYRYEKATSDSSWKLREAWRVTGDGKRTRLALPRA